MRSCRIITGGRGEGKTSRLLSLGLGQGFASIRSGDGYLLMDLATGERRLLMSVSLDSPHTIGRWHYDQDAFDWANGRLSSIMEGPAAIDEIGRLELAGGGFAPSLELLLGRGVELAITVRRDFLQDVVDRFRISSFSLEGSL